MEPPLAVHSARLRFAYWYTILGAGAFGVVIIVAPGAFERLFAMPSQDPYVIGILGSVWLAFAALAALGLRAPLDFSPILLLQLAYKSVWLVAVLLPRLIAGGVPGYAWICAAVWGSYIAVDLATIPFTRVLAPGHLSGPESAA